MTDSTAFPAPAKPGMSPKSLTGLFFLWVVLALAGLIGVVVFSLGEQQRDLRQWQRQLQLSADAKARGVEQWLSVQQSVLHELAENDSVKLYLAEINDGGAQEKSADQDDALALTNYLHNLLAVEADKRGFTEASGKPSVPVNLPVKEGAGLAIFGQDFTPITAAGNFSAPQNLPSAILQQFKAGKTSPLGPFEMKDGTQYLFFYAPITSVQADDAAAPIGYVAGIRKMDGAFDSLLAPSPQSEETTETELAAKNGRTVQYLSALKDGTAPRTLSLNDTTPDLDVPYAFNKPGTFARKLDYRGKSVLFASRAITGMPWILVHKVDENVAMAESTSRFTWFTICYLLLVGLVTAALIAVWRHASAARGKQNTLYYRTLANRIDRQQRLLALITGSTPNGIAIVDPKMQYKYVNRAAAAAANMPEEEILGSTLQMVLGAEDAATYVALVTKANDGHTVEKTIQEFGDKAHPRTVQSIFVPLADIPLPDREENGPGVLIVDRDITDYADARRKYEGTLGQLVDTLVELVDSRDPYAQHHSNGVALVAKAVAQQMKLPEQLQQACAEAGKLMNVGKIRAPETLLTQQKLSSTEKQNISHAMHASAEILKNIAFNGPVVETLQQAYEHVDGSGPHGLKEEQILPSARIIAIANAFVALISPRAYREAKGIDEALDELRTSVGTAYSRQMFTALEYFIANDGGKKILTDWQCEQKKDVKLPA